MKSINIICSSLIAIAPVALFAQQTATSIRIDENITWTDPDSSITDTGKAFWAWNQSSGSFEYSATNGTFNIAGNAEIGNTWSNFTDQNLSLNFLGSGNNIIFAEGKSIEVTAVGGDSTTGVNTGNTFTANVASSDVSAVNTLSVDTINVYGGRNYGSETGSTTVGVMAFNGNTTLKSTTARDAGANNERYTTNINLNSGTINGGTSKLITTNSNNVLKIETLQMNNSSVESYTNLPKAIMDIGGTNNTVQIRWLNINRNGADASSIIKLAAGNTFKVGYSWSTYSRIEASMASGLNFKNVYNATTGELSNGTLFSFEGVSEDGYVSTSKIVIESYNGASINAFVLLDLTSSISDLEKVEQAVELFTGLGSDPWGADSDYFIQIGSNIVGVGESWGNFSFDSVDTSNGKLIFNFTVPEPSTYAAIFGALALALALYRRRK